MEGKEHMVRRSLALLLICVLPLIAACHYYEDFRIKKGDADLKQEMVELRKAYRRCVQKYEDDPPLARERCGPYVKALSGMGSSASGH